MSAQLRPVVMTPKAPDADAMRRELVQHVESKMRDDVAPALKQELVAEINGRFADLAGKLEGFADHRIRFERWRAVALAGIAGIGLGALATWVIYSGAAFTGSAIATTDRQLDRIEAEQGEMSKRLATP